MAERTECKSPRTRNINIQGQEKMDVLAQEEIENSPLLGLSFYLGPSGTG
jgi:hypothetical protein